MAVGRIGGSRMDGGSSKIVREVCASCGATFERHVEHAWKLYFGRKQRWYCSYTCMRRDERTMLEAARAREQDEPAEERKETPVERAEEKTAIERAQENVARCRARYEQAQAMKLDGKAWAAMTARERKNANSRARNWLTKLKLAERELEENGGTDK